MYSDELSPKLDSSNTSPTLSDESIDEKFNIKSSPAFNSSMETKEQVSNIIQRANELQFVVQNIIKTHVPEKNGTLLFSSLNETLKVNDSNEYINNNNNDNLSLSLLKASQYDYDNIKDILDKSLFYKDICSMPPYFNEIYDTAYHGGLLKVGIDAEDFFIMN